MALFRARNENAATALEDIRTSLLNAMQDIPCYDTSQDALIDQAFEELKRPNTDAMSCLKIAKAHVLGYLSILECAEKTSNLSIIKQRVKKSKANLIEGLLLEVLEKEPALFYPHTEKLLLYFNAIRKMNADKKIPERIRQDEELVLLEQGQPLRQLDLNRTEALSRLKANRPLVFDLTTLGLGDACMLPPAIMMLASTLETIRSQSPIRLVVDKKIANMFRYMVGGRRNIEVYHVDDKSAAAFNLCFLTKLATGNQTASENVELGLWDDESEKKAGIIMGLRLFIDWIFAIADDKMCHDFLINEIDYVATNCYADNSKIFANTFPRAVQRSLSSILGIKIFGTSDRDDITECSQGIKKYIEEYIKCDPSLENQLIKLQQMAGFENGYICFIERGSDDFKVMTVNLFAEIVEKLADFCRQSNVGIVLIKTSNDKEDVADQITSLLLQRRIPYYRISIKEEIAYTLAFLRHARGVIGPDTFLTHAAEYFPKLPVLKIFSAGNYYTFRIKHNSIGVEHSLAKRSYENLDTDVFFESWLYKKAFIHPLTILAAEERINENHIIIQEIQDIFLERLRRGVEELCSRMRDQKRSGH